MLSHEPKNYALLSYEGQLTLRGVAFRSRRAEPFGEHFLRRALAALLVGNVAAVRDIYLETVANLRRRGMALRDVCSLVRLTKTPAAYAAGRVERRELPYEALLASGRTEWSPGERILVYRALGKRPALLPEDGYDDDDVAPAARPSAPPDYDVEYYLRLLRETFAARLARALTAEHYAAVFADPTQLSLFAPSLADARPILTVLAQATTVEDQDGSTVR